MAAAAATAATAILTIAAAVVVVVISQLFNSHNFRKSAMEKVVCEFEIWI